MVCMEDHKHCKIDGGKKHAHNDNVDGLTLYDAGSQSYYGASYYQNNVRKLSNAKENAWQPCTHTCLLIFRLHVILFVPLVNLSHLKVVENCDTDNCGQNSFYRKDNALLAEKDPLVAN